MSESIPLFSMLVSLIAMTTQLVFGVLASRRASAETQRQIAETKKQEKLHALSVEETYKRDVREWGQAVVDQMAAAQQLADVSPNALKNNDYALERAHIVGRLRGLLDKAQWLFPNLATPTRQGRDWGNPDKHQYSALESILYLYHEFDRMDEHDKDMREKVGGRIRLFRKTFAEEMRRAVDPHVRGEDIETLLAEAEASVHDDDQSKNTKPDDITGLKALNAIEERQDAKG